MDVMPIESAIAMMMSGIAAPCAQAARTQLKTAGCEVVTFLATGAGGRTMEARIAAGGFDGVLDLTTAELSRFDFPVSPHVSPTRQRGSIATSLARRTNKTARHEDSETGLTSAGTRDSKRNRPSVRVTLPVRVRRSA